MASLSAPELIDLREQSRRFEGFAGIRGSSAALTDGEYPEQVRDTDHTVVGIVPAGFRDRDRRARADQ